MNFRLWSLLLLAPSLCLGQVRPTTFAEVKNCKSLGEVTGKTMVCIPGKARADAFRQAKALGGTHIVWTNGRCIPFAGHRSTGEVFDCNAKESLADKLGAPGPLGLYLQLIPADLRAKLGRNTGAYVTAVADESPAFFANVLPGDVILRAGSTEVQTPKDFADATPGDTLLILRNGEEIAIETAGPE